jgi:predicted aconitase with swiveling domain
MSGQVQARAVIAGTGAGRILRLPRAISFWGDVDPFTGRLTDPREPWHGQSIAGRILVLPETRGSSSGSAVMLELLAGGHAPAALVLGRIDAIVGLGILVARELGYPTIPLLELTAAAQDQLADGMPARVEADGRIVFGVAA